MKQNCGYGSVLEHLPTICEELGSTCKKEKKIEPGMVVHRTLEATLQFEGQPGIPSETLFQKKQNKLRVGGSSL
jgi:hypothetical protein